RISPVASTSSSPLQKRMSIISLESWACSAEAKQQVGCASTRTVNSFRSPPSFFHPKVDIGPLPNCANWRTCLLWSSLVPAIRTVMVTMSPMFRNLVTELMIRHRCLNVVAELDTREGLQERLRSLAPDLILIGLRRNEGDEIGLSLLHNRPNAKVIAFSS